MSISLKNDKNESQGKLSEEKQAVEQLNRHRQMSEGGNSVLDRLTDSPNLVEKKKERQKRQKSSDRLKNKKNAHDEHSRARLPRIDEFDLDRAEQTPAKEISIHPEGHDQKKESPKKGLPAKQHGLPQRIPRRDTGDIPKSITISDDAIEDIDALDDLMDYIEEQVKVAKEADQSPVDAEVKEADQNRVDSSSRRSKSPLRKEEKTTRSKTASLPFAGGEQLPLGINEKPPTLPLVGDEQVHTISGVADVKSPPLPLAEDEQVLRPGEKADETVPLPLVVPDERVPPLCLVSQKESSNEIEKRERKSSRSSKDGSFALSKSEASECSKSHHSESIKEKSETSHLLEINEEGQVVTKRSMEKHRLKTMEQDPDFEEIPRVPFLRLSPKLALSIKKIDSPLQMAEQDSEFEEIMRVAIGSFPVRKSGLGN